MQPDIRSLSNKLIVRRKAAAAGVFLLFLSLQVTSLSAMQVIEQYLGYQASAHVDAMHAGNIAVAKSAVLHIHTIGVVYLVGAKPESLGKTVCLPTSVRSAWKCQGGAFGTHIRLRASSKNYLGYSRDQRVFLYSEPQTSAPHQPVSDPLFPFIIDFPFDQEMRRVADAIMLSRLPVADQFEEDMFNWWQLDRLDEEFPILLPSAQVKLYFTDDDLILLQNTTVCLDPDEDFVAHAVDDCLFVGRMEDGGEGENDESSEEDDVAEDEEEEEKESADDQDSTGQSQAGTSLGVLRPQAGTRKRPREEGGADGSIGGAGVKRYHHNQLERQRRGRISAQYSRLKQKMNIPEKTGSAKTLNKVEDFIDRVKRDDPERFAQLLLPGGGAQLSERSRQLQKIEENQRVQMQKMQQIQVQIASLFQPQLVARRAPQPIYPFFPAPLRLPTVQVQPQPHLFFNGMNRAPEGPPALIPVHQQKQSRDENPPDQ